MIRRCRRHRRRPVHVHGRILDRDGRVLATTSATPGGDLYRIYADRSLSAPLGYAWPSGSAGLGERLVLMGLRANDPLLAGPGRRSPIPRRR